jgi:hypothetical protein
MSWVKVDDQMPRHPKFLGLGKDRLPCQGVWLDGMCYASGYLTDGYIPAAALERGTERYAERLVRAGLWDRAEGGYRIHDYHDYQPTRAAVTESRKKNAERQSRHRNGVTNDVTEASVTAPRPVPSRPTPIDTYEYVDPAALYFEKVGRKPGKREMDWLEDLHVRYSRTELVAGMQAVAKGKDYLARLDAFMEGRAA